MVDQNPKIFVLTTLWRKLAIHFLWKSCCISIRNLIQN